jgi:hypothetical protein
MTYVNETLHKNNYPVSFMDKIISQSQTGQNPENRTF